MNKTTTNNMLNNKHQALPEPVKYGWIQNEISQYLVQKTYKDLGNQEAFVLRRIGTLAGDIYKMFINSTRPEDVQKYLESHEAGHIIFGHTSNEKTKDRINKLKIRAAWPKVQDMFPEEASWEKRFDSIIYNIVMDMEVNSKIFSHDEMLALNNALGGEGIWPEDYNFPVGLDYNTYLNLILQDPKKFLDDFQSQMNQNNGDGSQSDNENQGDNSSQQESQSSSGNGNSENSDSNSQDSQDSSGNNNSENSQDNNKGKSSGKSSTSKKIRNDHQFTEEALKRLEDYYKENSEEEKEATADRLEKAEAFENSIEMSNTPHEGSSNSGHELKEIQEIEMVTFQSIESDLKALLSKEFSIAKRDQLYNYNRNKHNSNVLIPRVTKAERHEPACMYILLDVSGSISSESIVSFVNAFKSVAKKLNRKSRIILWDTDLVSDNLVREYIKPISGGGTVMAKGIAYIAGKYHPSAKDYFFMVSDFQDDLSDWDKALRLLKCQKKAYIFNYGFSEEDCKEAFNMMGKYIQKNSYGTELASLWKNTKGININC